MIIPLLCSYSIAYWVGMKISLLFGISAISVYQPVANNLFCFFLQIYFTEQCIFLFSRGTSMWSCFCSLNVYCFLIRSLSSTGSFIFILFRSFNYTTTSSFNLNLSYYRRYQTFICDINHVRCWFFSVVGLLALGHEFLE